MQTPLLEPAKKVRTILTFVVLFHKSGEIGKTSARLIFFVRNPGEATQVKSRGNEFWAFGNEFWQFGNKILALGNEFLLRGNEF